MIDRLLDEIEDYRRIIALRERYIAQLEAELAQLKKGNPR